jgi:hypothetical protein
MIKMVDHAENVDCGAFVSEKFWHHFWQKTFSAESFSRQSWQSDSIRFLTGAGVRYLICSQRRETGPERLE